VVKRFYKQVAVVAEDGFFSIALDGRPVHSPGRAPLALPTEALAECVAAEWRAQGEELAPESMPMTRFVNSAIDRVRPRMKEVIDEISGYAATDLLCYRTDSPEDLAVRQDAAWQPLLDWAAKRYGVELCVTRSITPVPQDEVALAAIRDEIAVLDEYALSGLHSLTTASGSIVIALAVAEGRIGAADAASASLVDEAYQAEKWGEDPEAATRRDSITAEIAGAERFLAVAMPKPA
jgi:chaperone required for assembly of F1-ATPase